MLADLKVAMKRVAEAKDSTAAGEAEVLEGHDANGEPRKLMIVESDHKMQDVFRELFKKVGYRVLVTVDPDRLFQRLYEDARAADVLVISSGHIGRPALEAFNRLVQEPRLKHLPAVLLLGDQHGDWMKEATGDPRRLVVKMPLKTRELRQCVLTALAVK
jgi:CheY-like chemotaxis protein